MTLDKKSVQKIVIVALLLLGSWLCRFTPFSVSGIHYIGAALGLLRPLIFIGICAAWGVSLSRKIINRRLRIYLKSIAFCCILWLFFRTVKYELTFRGDTINTVLMYAYYLPFILIPTFGFFVSLYARRGERYNMPRVVYLTVSCISISAILFVFTNPFHESFWKHTPKPYSHAWGYYVVVGWTILLLMMTVFNIIVRIKIPGRRALSLLPILVLVIIAGYFLLVFVFPEAMRFISNDWTSFTCLGAVGLLQACITSGMLPSNCGYAKVFEAAEDGAIITDNDWNLCYSSQGATVLPKEILQKTENGAVMLDKNTILKGRKLHPGHVIWKEDVSDISTVLEELEQNKKELTAQNELDKENTRTELALSKAQEKNRLYDLSQAATAQQNKCLHETLSEYFGETDDGKRKRLLAKAAVLGAYIKRKGNLIFAGDGGTIKASELKLCFKESLRNMELLEANCYLDFGVEEETELSLTNALGLYDSFEAAVEAGLPDISAAFIRIREEGGGFRAIYSLASPNDFSKVVFLKEAEVTKDGDTWIVTLFLPKGGILE